MPLILGNIEFRDFEVPETIRFGGTQRLALHRLAGGQRVLEPLGHEDADVEFAGTLSGPGAVDRAKKLEQLCRTGAVSTLGWDAYYHSVIVRQFTADYSSDTWIPYRLSCVVVAQPTANDRDRSLRRHTEIVQGLDAAIALDSAQADSIRKVVQQLHVAGAPDSDMTRYDVVAADLGRLGTTADEQFASIDVLARNDGAVSLDLSQSTYFELARTYEWARAIAVAALVRAYVRQAAVLVGPTGR